MNDIDVSVIVCTCNRAAMLREALETLIRLETRGEFTYEIVVVDNGSTDDTPRVIESFQQETSVCVRRVYEPCRGVVPARNRGLAAAAGTWTAWFDDDQLADPLWLCELLACARRRQTQCVGGAVHLKLPVDCSRRLAPFCQGLLGQSLGPASERPYDRRFTPGTGNLLVHCDVFRGLGCFRETPELRGEDTEFFLRLRSEGIVTWYTPAAVVRHVIPAERLSFEYLSNVAARSGQGVARRELARRSGLTRPLICTARAAQALAHAAAWLWFVVVGDVERAFAARCRLAMAKGYFRQVQLRPPLAPLASPVPQTATSRSTP